MMVPRFLRGNPLNSSFLESQLLKVRGSEEQMATYSDSQIRETWQRLVVDEKKSLQEIQSLAAAMGAVLVQRKMGFRLHDVQIIGALATAAGAIIEMQTGEGKTIVCGLAALIRAATDDSVHVATTNDYLAERDHESVKAIFEPLQVTSAFIGTLTNEFEKMAGYRCNIVYAPGYVFGFDYLRDQTKIRDAERLVLGREILEQFNQDDTVTNLVQPFRQSIIVDEADSVLIDESTSPLILSGGADRKISAQFGEAFVFAQQVAGALQEGKHFEIDDNAQQVELTKAGLDLIHARLKTQGRLYLTQPWPNYVKNSLQVLRFLTRDEDYVVKDDEIHLVDQFTGRIFTDRTLQNGLHQALECKEGVTINPPNKVLARITRQKFFRLYEVVAGMAGTISGSEHEMEHFYASRTVILPPNQPGQRTCLPTRFFDRHETKVAAIVQDIVEREKTGQPILIGTQTIGESHELFDCLVQAGVRANLLNGMQDESEAEIVSQAGRAGAITIATNMAGRGTDIKLDDQAKDSGGLHVICTQCSESQRVDRQLVGRSARQGDPGSCQFFVSATDDLLTRHAPKLASKIKNSVNAVGESHTDFHSEIIKIQERIERDNFEQRCKLVHHDNWMDSVREAMTDA